MNADAQPAARRSIETVQDVRGVALDLSKLADRASEQREQWLWLRTIGVSGLIFGMGLHNVAAGLLQ